jgi:UDP-glucose 4-epimerase
MPINEETELKLPESSYGKTKQMGERLSKILLLPIIRK